MHPSGGGPPRVVVGHALQLRRQGHEPEVLATLQTGDEQEVRGAWRNLAEAGVELRLFQRSRPNMVGLSSTLNSFIDQSIDSFDILHIHGIWEHCLAYAGTSAHNAGVPFVLAPHGMLDRWSRRRSAFRKAVGSRLLGTRRMMQLADAAQFGSNEERDEASDLKIDWRSFVVPNGLFIDQYVRTPGLGVDQLATEFPQLAGRSPLLLFYSRMHPKKGVHLLLDAVAQLAKIHPRIGLLVAAIAQDREYEAQIRARAISDDLKNCSAVTTKYTGDRGKLLFNAADVFVLPSHQEGFSIAIVEAMAYGLPIVITEPCHMSFVRDIRGGEVVPVTLEGIMNGLLHVIEAGSQGRAEMGMNGRKWVENNCSWENVGKQLEFMYKEVVRSKRF